MNIDTAIKARDLMELWEYYTSIKREIENSSDLFHIVHAASRFLGNETTDLLTDPVKQALIKAIDAKGAEIKAEVEKL